LTCICGHDKHDWETHVCLDSSCFCIEFRLALGDGSIILDHVKYIRQIEKVSEKVKYILTNIKYSRNFPHKQFVFFYWRMADTLILNKSVMTESLMNSLEDPENITRSRQKLARDFPELYGPFDLTLIEERELKQTAMTMWAIQ
jgi:hypothetical protein